MLLLPNQSLFVYHYLMQPNTNRNWCRNHPGQYWPQDPIVLKEVEDGIDRLKVPVTEIDDFKLKNVISLTPVMAIAFLDSTTKEPASLAIEFLSAMSSYHESHATEMPPT